MCADLFWKVVNEAGKVALDKNQNPSPLHMVVRNILKDRQSQPKPYYAPQEAVVNKIAGNFQQIISSLVVKAVEPEGSPSTDTHPGRGMGRPNKDQIISQNSNENTENSDLYQYAAEKLTVVGGTLLKYLVQERIPELYKNVPGNGSIPFEKVLRREPSSNSHLETKCLVCLNKLNMEAVTVLNCKHIFHSKCLLCCVVCQEVNDKQGKFTCPIEECRIEVTKQILEKIKNTKF